MFIVTGSARSGTNWFCQLLAEYVQGYIVQEPFHNTPGLFHPGGARGLKLPTAIDAFLETDPDGQRMRNHWARPLDESRADELARLYDAHYRGSIGFKSLVRFVAPSYERRWPGAKFIHVGRRKDARFISQMRLGEPPISNVAIEIGEGCAADIGEDHALVAAVLDQDCQQRFVAAQCPVGTVAVMHDELMAEWDIAWACILDRLGIAAPAPLFAPMPPERNNERINMPQVLRVVRKVSDWLDERPSIPLQFLPQHRVLNGIDPIAFRPHSWPSPRLTPSGHSRTRRIAGPSVSLLPSAEHPVSEPAADSRPA